MAAGPRIHARAGVCVCAHAHTLKCGVVVSVHWCRLVFDVCVYECILYGGLLYVCVIHAGMHVYYMYACMYMGIYLCR